MKIFISSADLLNKMRQENGYILDAIPDGLNCPMTTVLLDKDNEILPENDFKVSMTNYDLVEGTPERFLQLLDEAFDYDKELISQFRKLISMALTGKGYLYGVSLHGNINTINDVMAIISGVFGSYYYEIENVKKISRMQASAESIPNCCILALRIKNNILEKSIIEKIQDNEYFAQTALNHDKYIPFYIVENNRIFVDNTIKVKMKELTGFYSVSDILNEEGSKILNWFADNNEVIDIDLSSIHETVDFGSTIIAEWLKQNYNVDENDRSKISATALYDDYAVFVESQGQTPITSQLFFRKMNKYFPKKRNSAGIYYLGISRKHN